MGRPGTPRALVVDDDDANRLVLELMLEAAGLEAVGAGSGQEALARLARDRFDLVVTDLRMPGLDGHGLLAAIRGQPRLNGLLVVATSADLMSNRPAEALDDGFAAFLVKPMLVSDVLACVERLGLSGARRAA